MLIYSCLIVLEIFIECLSLNDCCSVIIVNVFLKIIFLLAIYSKKPVKEIYNDIYICFDISYCFSLVLIYLLNFIQSKIKIIKQKSIVRLSFETKFTMFWLMEVQKHHIKFHQNNFKIKIKYDDSLPKISPQLVLKLLRLNQFALDTTKKSII